MQSHSNANNNKTSELYVALRGHDLNKVNQLLAQKDQLDLVDPKAFPNRTNESLLHWMAYWYAQKIDVSESRKCLIALFKAGAPIIPTDKPGIDGVICDLKNKLKEKFSDLINELIQNAEDGFSEEFLRLCFNAECMAKNIQDKKMIEIKKPLLIKKYPSFASLIELYPEQLAIFEVLLKEKPYQNEQKIQAMKCQIDRDFARKLHDLIKINMCFDSSNREEVKPDNTTLVELNPQFAIDFCSFIGMKQLEDTVLPIAEALISFETAKQISDYFRIPYQNILLSVAEDLDEEEKSTQQCKLKKINQALNGAKLVKKLLEAKSDEAKQMVKVLFKRRLNYSAENLVFFAACAKSMAKEFEVF